MEKYDKVVLLLIDVQRAFFSDIPPIGAAFPDFRHNVERLLGLCRSDEVGIEVVHVRAVYNPEVSAWTAYWHALNPDKKTVVTEEPEDFTRELPGEKVIHKVRIIILLTFIFVLLLLLLSLFFSLFAFLNQKKIKYQFTPQTVHL
jgi:nicotinamidase-related amidase